MRKITNTQIYQLLAVLIVLVVAVVALNSVWPGIFPQTSISSPGDRREGVIVFGSVKILTSSDSPYTVLSTDRIVLADASSGNIVVKLPNTLGVTGLRISIKKVDSSSNTVSIDPFSSETIDRISTDFVLDLQDETLIVLCDGDEWHVVGFSTWVSDRVTTTSVTSVIHLRPLSSEPATCSKGDLHFSTSGKLKICSSTNIWEPLAVE